jgi:Zn-dependent protease
VFGGLRLGKLFGIPVQINFSFLILAGIFAIARGLPGLLLLVVMFASVLLHELGHSLVARRLGVPILGIDLHFFGGAAKMGRMPSSAREEILIAGAGPLVSFALGVVGIVLLLITGWSGFTYLAGINLILGAFNLLPALPMDGGRIFRALLSRRMGRLRATAVAVKVARGIAIALGVFALIRFNPFLIGLAVLLWIMASAELRAAQMWHHASQGGGGMWPGFQSTQGPGDVEVLGHDRQPVGGAGGAGAFRIEEQVTGRSRRWIIRDHSGQIIFYAEQPLRW